MLTDVEIKALSSLGKPLKKADGGGLFLLVGTNGSKLWRLSYRFGGKQKTISGGRYPHVKLAAARKWRDEAKTLLAAGVDPSVARREGKRQARAAEENSFERIARSWMAANVRAWSPRYARVIKVRMEADIFPEIGSLGISQIDPAIMLKVIRKIENRGSIDMAHRVRNYCGEVFRFGIAEGKCTSDPTRDIAPAMKRKPPTKHRAKVEARDLPAFFAKLAKDEGERISHLALRWTILTMVRTQETRFAEWNEFEGLDGPEPLWRIPAHRMKMRTEHVVPLPAQAIKLLAEIRAIHPFLGLGNERLSRYLFPVATSKSGTISENRMLDIMYRMGLRGKATVHGFRGLASTVLNESGEFSSDWIEMQLAHIPRGVRAAYNSARYLDHRRKMMNWWADYLNAAEAKDVFV
jgi:integrase